MKVHGIRMWMLTLAVFLVLPGCGSDATAAGTETRVAADFPAGEPCAYCGEPIPEERFGGEVVTRSGDVYRFMSVECLAAFMAEGRVPESEVRSVRVVDYNDGERLIDARSAYYVQSENRPSPSGLNLLAIEEEKIAWNLHFFFGGQRMEWDEVIEAVRREWKL